jgi:hypothetical protein
MYQKPKVERFGTFRDLTLIGNQGSADGMFVAGVSPNGGNCSLVSGTPSQPTLIECRYS